MIEDDQRVLEAARALGEHFDTVHVFATRHDPAEKDGTVVVDDGVGNWYARQGQIAEWLEFQRENVRLAARENGEDDDGD
jgi:hypothetical protein